MPSTAHVDLTWAEYELAHPILVPPTLNEPHRITRKTAASKGWQIVGAVDDLGPAREQFAVQIRHADAGRVLLLIDTFLKACEARGFELRHDARNVDHQGISAFIDGEPVPLRLIERGSFVTHLSLEVGPRYGGKRTWKDSPRRPLEKRLNEVMIALRSIAYARIAHERERQDEEQRLQALLDEREELRARVEAEQRKVDALHAEAANWQRAQLIRTYIATVQAQRVTKQRRKERTAWAAWAHDQADRLDPLSVSPQSILDTPRNRYRELGQFEVLNEDGSIESIWG